MRRAAVDVVQRRYSKAQSEAYAADFDFNKLGLPILNHRDGHFWIVDGQHRIAALLLLGFGECTWECEVYENLTDAEMAEIFLGRDDRRRIDNFTKFMVSCTANRNRETEVRRVVESNQLKISRQKGEGCVGAVTSLLKIFDAYGSVVLGQVLRTIRDSFAADASAFDGLLIEGLGHYYNRFNGKPNERSLIERLSQFQHGVRGILMRAEAMKEKNGNQKTQCVAAVCVDIFNKGRTQGRLPSWWKVPEETRKEDRAAGKRHGSTGAVTTTQSLSV